MLKNNLRRVLSRLSFYTRVNSVLWLPVSLSLGLCVFFYMYITAVKITFKTNPSVFEDVYTLSIPLLKHIHHVCQVTSMSI